MPVIPAGRLTVATPETMAVSVRGNTVATDAVDERVEAVAVDIISNDPTIKAAAQTAADSAVTAKVNGLDLVLHSDPGAPRVVRNFMHAGKYVSELTMDNAYRVASILYQDGSRWPAETSGGGGGGAVGVTSVDARGDSMTEGFGGGGVSYPNVMNGLVPVPVTNNGKSYYTSTEVALEGGGLDLWVTVTGGTIPASGSVGVTVSISSWWSSTARSFSGSLNGIPGVLAKSDTGVWSFTRGTAGSATACPPETRWMAATRATGNSAPIIWIGRNNVNVDRITRDVRALANWARMRGMPYLVIPVFNAQSEASGSTGYNNVKAVNDALEAEHGQNFYDLRGWLIRNGLAAAGITPTAADTTAISEDRIPPSLMSDALHLKDIAYRACGERLAAVTTTKGWYTL